MDHAIGPGGIPYADLINARADGPNQLRLWLDPQFYRVYFRIWESLTPKLLVGASAPETGKASLLLGGAAPIQSCPL
jgi:hypothetical protein